MDQHTVNEVHGLKHEGISVRKTAVRLGLSKGMVEKALMMTPTLEGQSPPSVDAPTSTPSSSSTGDTDTPKPRGKTADEVELGKLDLTLSHQRRMKELQIREDEVALERKRIDLRADEVENDKKLLSLKEQQIANTKQEEANKQIQQQTLLVTKFNRLLKELLKNCEDATWSEEDVDEYIKKAKKILANVDKICEDKSIDEDTLLIYQSTEKLIKLMEHTKENESHLLGSDVDFDFDKKQINEIKSWQVDHFSDLVDDEKEDSDENEEDEDSEDEDNDNEDDKDDGQITELLTTYNDLVDELLDNSDNTEWSEKDYEDYEKRITDFQTELTEHLDEFEDIDADDLAITGYTEKLLEFVSDQEAVIEENDDEKTVTVNTKPKQKQMLKEWKLDDFWQEAE